MTKSSPEISIRPATFPPDREKVAALFRAYAASLPINLDFQNFEIELADLPGKYGVERGGAVFLAFVESSAPAIEEGGKSSTSTVPGEESQSEVEAPATQNQEYKKDQVQDAIGCIGLRSFPPSPKTCELKRLYLSPSSRGLGVGKLLLDAAVQKARALGYSEMLLDTLGSMAAARRLYEKAGFEQIESYYESVEGAVFYRLRL